jgi:DNA-binding NarL/FixJ family response regulator
MAVEGDGLSRVTPFVGRSLAVYASQAIKQVAAGELLFAPQISEPTEAISGRDCELTPRELEILQLIVDGKSNKEIAGQLNLSDNTVGVHRANIMRGLGIHKTTELVAYAIRKRLVNIP